MCVKRENNMQQYEAMFRKDSETEASTEISLMWTWAKMTAADPRKANTHTQTLQLFMGPKQKVL